MTRTDAACLGFLLGCAELGMDPVAAADRLEKTANAADGVLDDLWRVPRSALMTGLLAGGSLGALYGLAGQNDMLKVKRPPQLDELQKAETTATYRQNTQDILDTIAAIQRRRAREAVVPRSPFGA